ncbi:hypothetical protein CAPTEDRAFT_218288 [Capitella teleta]|uniref:Uncharacterized protein n=1 Tax=Capitella teleta TaxID=283909 RepID=R7TXW4_CAPTE|nr:hypothetical protein CAPTEDRAFT_218288 [Capitella teleta]|eukprot:ELT98584.1 hypothetical protein CAPTEDRAFT_218288 [Capitella teleta]
MGPKSKDIGTTVSNAEFVEIENEYDEIQDISRKPRDLPPSAITKKTQDITYYNPSPKASNSDANHVVLPATGGSMFGSNKVLCEEEWQNKGIKKFTATINKERHQEEREYVNQFQTKKVQ